MMQAGVTFTQLLSVLFVAALVVAVLLVGACLQPKEEEKKRPEEERRPEAEQRPKELTASDKVLCRLQRRRRQTESRVLDPITAALEGILPINQPFDEGCLLNTPREAFDEVDAHLIRAETGGITALMWACQWKLIEGILGEAPVLGADVVGALLRHGADADLRCQTNGCSALSFVVKYGDVEALNMLVEAGADPLVRDCHGKNLLWNAVERSDPAIITRLLELGVDPKEETELFLSKQPKKKTVKKPTSKFISVTEQMLMGTYKSFISWINIGPPDQKDFVRCFLLLLDHGAKFRVTPPVFHATKILVGSLEVDSIKLAPDDHERREYLDSDIRPDLKLALARAAVAHRAKELQTLRQDCEKTRAAINERELKAREKADRKGYTLAGDDLLAIWGGPSVRGPVAMTKEQLNVECTAHGLPIGSRSSMERAVVEEIWKHVNTGGQTELHLEVGDTHTIQRGDGHQTTIPSAGGPVQIRASVNGVQVDCFVSTTSSFTLLSNDFAKRVGIRSSRLISKAFMCNGEPLGETRRLRDVRIQLGEVEVSIRTAIAANVMSSRDVQLGMDFFAQAVYAQIDVFIKSEPPMLVSMLPVYGSNHCRMRFDPPTGAREELRFHAECGGFVILPIQHKKVKANEHAYSSTVNMDLNARMDTCAVCGEHWPGMKLCEMCWKEGIRVPFCSNECARAAKPKHMHNKAKVTTVN